jgi:hypothetical protein
LKKNHYFFISKLKENSGNYILGKNLFDQKSEFIDDSLHIVSSLVRKTNSINNSQFGRRKYKKLKKKY